MTELLMIFSLFIFIFIIGLLVGKISSETEIRELKIQIDYLRRNYGKIK